MSADRVIPFTPPGPLWSQREYVTAMGYGVNFACHRADRTGVAQHFHYHFPTEPPCCTTIVVDSDVQRYVDHEFVPDRLNWINQCRAAMAKELK